MGVNNREMGPGLKRVDFSCNVEPASTGATFNLLVVPWPSYLFAASQASNGLSGSPFHSLWIQRFVAGAGVTSIQIGNSLGIVTFGTSGCQGYSVPNGYTTPLLANDVIIMNTTGANTAVASCTVTLVLENLEDLRSHLGS